MSAYRIGRWATAPLLVFSMLVGCAEERIQARGFVLPPGDPNAGRRSFETLSCNHCHVIDGIELPPVASWLDDEFFIRLGGPVTEVKTYGDLVTSVIHPSYRTDRAPVSATAINGESRMLEYNRVMTVQELVDIVTFLEANYDALTDGYAVR